MLSQPSIPAARISKVSQPRHFKFSRAERTPSDTVKRLKGCRVLCDITSRGVQLKIPAEKLVEKRLRLSRNDCVFLGCGRFSSCACAFLETFAPLRNIKGISRQPMSCEDQARISAVEAFMTDRQVLEVEAAAGNVPNHAAHQHH